MNDSQATAEAIQETLHKLYRLSREFDAAFEAQLVAQSALENAKLKADAIALARGQAAIDLRHLRDKEQRETELKCQRESADLADRLSITIETVGRGRMWVCTPSWLEGLDDPIKEHLCEGWREALWVLNEYNRLFSEIVSESEGVEHG